MKSIKQIFDGRNKVNKYISNGGVVIKLPPMFDKVREEVDKLPQDYQLILNNNFYKINEFPKDSGNFTIPIIGKKNEKIDGVRYKIDLHVQESNGIVIKAYYIGYGSSVESCYIRELVGKLEDKPKFKKGKEENIFD